MSNFAKGKHAKFISDRSGMEFPYKEMVQEWNGSRVHISEFEPKQPQLEPRAHGADPEGLQMQNLLEQNQLQIVYYQVIHLILHQEALRLQLQNLIMVDLAQIQSYLEM